MPAAAQQPTGSLSPCGNGGGKVAWLKQYQSETAAFPRTEDTLSVPVTVHVVGTNDGTGFFSEVGVFEAFCTLNQDFEPAGIRFFIEGDIQYHTNSIWYDHTFPQGAAMMAQQNVPNTINCYIVDSPAGNCGYSNYSLGIALAKSCISPNDHTWAHEVGHYLSLPHPFSGWEGYDHDYSQPAPAFVNGEPVEKVDGSNCHFAADGFCDTPPDYLNYRWPCNGQSQSNTTQYDPDEAAFQSDGTLFMSYALDQCANRFSAEQIEAMRANLLTDRSNLLYNTSALPPPVAADIAVLTPLPGDTIPTFLDVPFAWEPLPWAEGYYLEITVLSNFQAVLHRFATQGATTYTVENLLKKNKTYYWRVRPFNRWHTCKSYSPVFSFQTGDVETVNTTTTVQHLPQLNILRNPIPHGSPEALFTVSAPLPNPLSVALVAPTGGILRKQSLPAVPADGIVRLAVDNLPPGLYFILVETAAQVLSGKLMIR
ncbi:MAG: hypothetical protein RLY31_3105 [Bacteroidota bacterium]